MLRLDPDNEYALSNLEKLYEEQHQWDEAYTTRQKLAALDGPAAQTGHLGILAFLENELGTQALKRMDYDEAARRFEAAIELDATNTPAHLNLGDVHRQRGDVAGAVAAWERLVERSPDRAYLAFARLEDAYPQLGDSQRFPDLCRRLIADNPQDWRARLALARHLASQGQPREALDLLFDALVQNPHALSLHQAIWQMLSRLQLPAALVSQLHRSDARRRSSTSIRTSACAAAIAAPSCSGSARIATIGTRSSRSGSRRRRIPKPA